RRAHDARRDEAFHGPRAGEVGGAVAGLWGGVRLVLRALPWGALGTEWRRVRRNGIRHCALGSDFVRYARQRRLVPQNQVAADGHLLGLADSHERGGYRGRFAHEVIGVTALASATG